MVEEAWRDLWRQELDPTLHPSKQGVRERLGKEQALTTAFTTVTSATHFTQPDPIL